MAIDNSKESNSLVLNGEGTGLFDKDDMFMNIVFKNIREINDTQGSITYIGSYKFENCKALKNVNLPQVTDVNDAVFKGCSNLETVNIPQLKSAGLGMFSECVKLKHFRGDNFTNTEGYTFTGCTNLSWVYTPMVSRWGALAFASCTNLKSVILGGSSIVGIANNTFDSCAITVSSYLGYYGSVYVPASLISSYAVSSYWSSISERLAPIEDLDLEVLNDN